MGAKPTVVQLILNATVAGKAMLTAANAAAQKTLLSLQNVDNTADTAKPVSTAQQTAIDGKIGGTVGTTTNRLVQSSGTGGTTVQATGITVSGGSNNSVSGINIMTANAVVQSDAFSRLSLGGGSVKLKTQTTALLELLNNAESAYANLTALAITATGPMCAGTYTAATLPSASANAYKFATVSDSSVVTFGGTVAGGGSSKVQVFSNGTNWTVCAA